MRRWCLNEPHAGHASPVEIETDVEPAGGREGGAAVQRESNVRSHAHRIIHSCTPGYSESAFRWQAGCAFIVPCTA